MPRFCLSFIASSLFFVHTAVWAASESDPEVKSALDQVNAHYNNKISGLLEGLSPEAAALASKVLRDKKFNSAVDTVKNSFMPVLSEATLGLREAGQNYYTESVRPKFEGESALSAAAKVAVSAKGDLRAKVRREIESLNSQRNNDIRAIYSQNKIPLPTSLRGE